MNLTPLQQEFVLHFGEMGSRWGIARTVGQIYAVLFLSPEPLHAENLQEAVGVSRSNVSMSLKELQAWNLVRLEHKADDRRDHFSTPDDLWEIVRTLVAERKKREIDPTLTKLRALQMETPVTPEDRHAHARMTELREMIELMSGWYDDVERLDTERLIQLLKLGSKVRGLLDKASNLPRLTRGRTKEGGSGA